MVDNETAEVIEEENNFVDDNKIVEKEVILVEPRKEFDESMSSTTVCSTCDDQVHN